MRFALVAVALLSAGCECEPDPFEQRERETVRAYIEAVRAAGRVPPPSSTASPAAYPDFEPFFLSAADFRNEYVIGEHTSGFGKSCDAFAVHFRDGPKVRFCFNRMVINCDRADACGCPYDFNWKPQPRPAPAQGSVDRKVTGSAGQEVPEGGTSRLKR